MGFFQRKKEQDALEKEALERKRRERIRKLKAIEITTNRVVNDTLAGQYHSVFKGRGLEFDQVRLYSEGDDIRAIDWNVTARAEDTYVRQYHEERELTVMLLVDCSASGQFGTKKQTKVDLAAEISALMAFSAIRNNDKVGLMLFTDRVEKVIYPKKGRKHVLRVVDEILSFEPEGKGTDIARALVYLSRLKIHRAVVFLISDFLDEDYEDGLRIVGRKHDLVAFSIKDEAEEKLHDLGLVPMEDAESGNIEWVDTSDKALRLAYEEQWRKHEEETKTTFRRHKIELVPIVCGEDYTPRLIAFFRKRMKKL